MELFLPGLFLLIVSIAAPIITAVLIWRTKTYPLFKIAVIIGSFFVPWLLTLGVLSLL